MSKKKAQRPELTLIQGDLGRTQMEKMGFISRVDSPSEEKILVKEVPAKVDGVVVGTAYIYNDGTVDYVLDPDAEEEAVEKIKALEDLMSGVGYSIGTEE